MIGSVRSQLLILVTLLFSNVCRNKFHCTINCLMDLVLKQETEQLKTALEGELLKIEVISAYLIVLSSRLYDKEQFLISLRRHHVIWQELYFLTLLFPASYVTLNDFVSKLKLGCYAEAALDKSSIIISCFWAWNSDQMWTWPFDNP